MFTLSVNENQESCIEDVNVSFRHLNFQNKGVWYATTVIEEENSTQEKIISQSVAPSNTFISLLQRTLTDR